MSKKTKRDKVNTPTKEQLVYHREYDKLTREQIASRYDVSIATVRRWIKEYEIPRPTYHNKRRDTRITSSGELIARPDDGITRFERACTLLGTRLTEKPKQGYFLDNRPTNIDKIFQAAELLM